MPQSHPQKVQTFLQDLEMSHDLQFQIVDKLLEICFEIYPNLTTNIKYGGIIILLNDRFVGGLFIYKNHVTFEFGLGYLLKDPEKILLGNGQFRRHLKFEKLEDINSTQISFYLRQLQDLV
jgi:hypothetical protein